MDMYGSEIQVRTRAILQHWPQWRLQGKKVRKFALKFKALLINPAGAASTLVFPGPERSCFTKSMRARYDAPTAWNLSLQMKRS